MNAKLTTAKGDKTGTIQEICIWQAEMQGACADIEIDGQSYDVSEVDFSMDDIDTAVEAVEAIVRGDQKYSVQTDGFSCDDFFAGSLNEAIEYAFSGEGLGKIVDEDSLRAKFQKYADDGGYCKIECEGEEVLVIGKPF